MDEKAYKRLVELTSELRARLALHETHAVAGKVMVFDLERANESGLQYTLPSPARQLSFLLGLLLSSEEPACPEEFDGGCWETCVSLLNEIFGLYVGVYFDSPEDLGMSEEKWRHHTPVAMVAFLHYFNSGLLATADQVINRVATDIAPFDNELLTDFGLSASDAIKVVGHLCESVQQDLDRASELTVEASELRDRVISSIPEEEFSVDRMRAEMGAVGGIEVMHSYVASIESIGFVRLEDLEKAYGQAVAQAFWNTFTISRGDTKGLEYITEENPIDCRPLIRLSDNEAFCPRFNALHPAVLQVFEKHLCSSASRDSFLRRRDKNLEQETAKLLGRIFPPSEVIETVFETPGAMNEHDIVVASGTTCLVVECKASPPVEPFRDSEKAFTRVSRHFRSERGIQKGYEQGIHLWRKWSDGELVTLFDRDGNQVLEVSKASHEHFFVLCVTRDNFGFLATDLSMLLKREPDEPFPWALNVVDLSTITDAWQYFGWSEQRFLDYLRDRVKLHGIVGTDDELDFVGFFIRHGTLNHLFSEEKAYHYLEPGYACVFDDIYRAMNDGGPPVVYDPTAPVTTDFRGLLRASSSAIPETAAPKQKMGKKVGRNDRCPCGSEKKYKRCCLNKPRPE